MRIVFGARVTDNVRAGCFMQHGMSVKSTVRLFGGRLIAIACAVVLLQMSANAQNFTRQSLHNHVPRAVERLHLQPLSKLSSEKRLNLAIGLPLRNQQALDDLLRQIYNPTSPNYHHYLTPEQFTEQFGPTERDYQAVIASMESKGLTVTYKHPNRVVLDVSGSVPDIEKAFHVGMRVYKHPREARTFYAPDTEPSVDLAVPILHISGMDNYSLPHPMHVVKPIPNRQAMNMTPNSNSGSGPDGSYMGNDFRAAYVPGVTLDGSGQTVGLLEFDGYYSSDIAAYESQAGLPNVTLTNVTLGGFSGTPTTDSGAVAEVSLDIEMVISMAPGVSKIIVYEAPNEFTSTAWSTILSRMANDNLAKQLSCSWGDSSPGSPDPTSEQIFRQMAAQGQSFFNASGDSDAFTSGIPFPSESTNITQVGGTTLTTTGVGGSYESETAWNRGRSEKNSYVGSGGGISTNYSIPDWQQGIDMSINHGSTTMRNVPDVALTADDVYVVYNNGQSNVFGGTSCAAPLWAGFIALVNQQAAAVSKPPVGFINPAIYAIGTNANYAANFHDITTGDNYWSGSPTNFPAVPGYDLCTGWGTPSGQNLINAFVPPDILQISPVTPFVASGPVGGPFSAASQSFSLTNTGTASLNWFLVNTSAWLNASLDSGVLAIGGQTNVTISLNSTANTLLPGIYTASVWFTNQTSEVVQNRQFTLQLGQSSVQNGGFESGDFSFWTLVGNTSIDEDFQEVLYNGIVDIGSFLDGSATNYIHSGIYGMAMGDTNLASFSQTLSTLPGQNYLLSFWLNNFHGEPPNQFEVNWNTNATTTNTIFYQTNMPAINNWTNMLFTVTATGTNTTLQFGAQNDNYLFGLDDVNLWPIPTPSFRAVSKTNNAVTFTWNSLASIMYQVEYSTNLATTNWTILSTNTATGPILTLTNPTSSDPQRFYRIRRLP